MRQIDKERPSALIPPIPPILGTLYSNALWRVFYPLEEELRDFCIWRNYL